MSLGNKIGRGLGIGAAHTVDLLIKGAVASGQFGADVMAGSQTGYTERAATLHAQRMEAKKKRDEQIAALAAEHRQRLAASVEPAAEPAPVIESVRRSRARA